MFWFLQWKKIWQGNDGSGNDGSGKDGSGKDGTRKFKRHRKKNAFVKMGDAVKNVLNDLLKAGSSVPGPRIKLSEQDIKSVCVDGEALLRREPNVLTINGPVTIVGDIHGQHYDLLRIFEAHGVPPQTTYLFLGDYVDRGEHGIEVMVLLLALKLAFPRNMYLLRGNHECHEITKLYGFHEECKERYSPKLWEYFVDVFNVLPVCAIVQKKIFCVHAGISPDIDFVGEINKHVSRPSVIPESGPLCDLMWSDPEHGAIGWTANDRGASYVFGQDTVERFLKLNNLEIICRAHQVVQNGYEFLYGGKVITIFSAPSYTGKMDNSGAVLIVDDRAKCRISAICASKAK
jgi:serine/threonine-protein phosphatase PP1 catalytic subunit